ncbi:MAG: ATP-binding protein [Polyangia bacterium]
MDALIEKLIGDFHERELPALTPRSTVLPALYGKIDSIIGMRRSGRTTFLFQRMRELLEEGVPKESLLYVNFDDDRLRRMRLEELGRVTEVYYRLYPELKDRRCHFFFDEIQNIDGWEAFARRLLDTENAQIAITGSSAKLLSREIATSLRGRSLATEIFPFDFAEALAHGGVEPPGRRPAGSRARARLTNALRGYLAVGGFPEVQGVAGHLRTRILQEYVDLVVYKDVVERHLVRNVLPLRILTHKLLAEPASRFSVNKFYNDLRSQGVTCTKNAIYEHLDQLVDAYLVSAIAIHSRSERVRRVNPRKVYPVDPGLATAYRSSPSADLGRQLETFVFDHLRRSSSAISYYQTRGGFEVDFIASFDGGDPALVGVAASLSDRETATRERRALSEAMAELGLRTATLVTLEEEDTVQEGSARIEVVPAWKWALQISDRSPRN